MYIQLCDLLLGGKKILKIYTIKIYTIKIYTIKIYTLKNRTQKAEAKKTHFGPFLPKSQFHLAILQDTKSSEIQS